MAYNSKADKKTSLQAKVQNTQLKRELKAIEKAEESNARYQQCKETQFRTAYGKYLTTGNFETSLIKNDSFRKATQEYSDSTPRPKEQVPLHKLLYTHGEVDVDKVLCIHLLSVHHHKPLSYTQEKNLRLFPRRSKPSVLESSALPFYILEIDHKIFMESRTSLPQGQEVIIIVNSSLEKLITSIVEVLAIVSPQKLKKIRETLMNKKSIQEIMVKTKILNFLAQLRESPVLMSLENYRIEIAEFKDEPISAPNVLTVSPIMVKDKSRKIEQIQSEIRNTINAFVEKNVCLEESWSMLHKKYCDCGKKHSAASVGVGKAISLLNDEGTEFARVTGSGCRLPRTASVLSTSITAIIKSSPKDKSVASERISAASNTVIPSSMKNQEGKLIHSMLHKMKNSQRILIGKKAADFKSQQMNDEKLSKQKLPINKIIEDVFSRDSLLSFASNAENEELKLMFQPCCKGGLGMGSSILNSGSSNKEKSKPSRLSVTSSQADDEVIPQMIKRERSAMKIAEIKQEIFMSETRNKMKKFIHSDNPGEASSST